MSDLESIKPVGPKGTFLITSTTIREVEATLEELFTLLEIQGKLTPGGIVVSTEKDEYGILVSWEPIEQFEG